MDIKFHDVYKTSMYYDGTCYFDTTSEMLVITSSIFCFEDLTFDISEERFVPKLFDILYITDQGLVLVRDRKKIDFKKTYKYYEILGYYMDSIWNHRRFLK